ncbi:hypothetical protein P8918_13410 [Bacillus spizizenii]|nr:hypothetical protein [Bacillus spizizenii]MCY8890566.1 hypothetical protein [Bacillus spizizenii]MEC0842025.1 hypothetical protein [Bacillus spizizenii]
MAGGNFGGGTGAQLDPFLIEDAHDFNAMRLYSNGYYFQLVKDINLNTPPYNAGTGWIPIPSFNSQIDGQGHKVSGLRIWSKGDDVGLFLSTGGDFVATNIHFDDVYMELITKETSSKKFTFFGAASSPVHTLQGISITGKMMVDAPKVTARLLVYTTANSTTARIEDCYFDLENLGVKTITLYGYTIGSYRGDSFIYPTRNIVKLKGNFDAGAASSYGKITPKETYLIEDEGYEYKNFSSEYVTVTSEFLSKPENIPDFVEASHLGRQTWYFPGTTHIRMMDYSRNKFLLEVAGDIFTYDSKTGLVKIGEAPLVVDMFTAHGIDYIETIPVNVWNGLKQDYGSVEIHCYVEKIPGKSLVSAKEPLLFDQALNNKVVMRSEIVFEDHNNDLHRIKIPVSDQRLRDLTKEDPKIGTEDTVGASTVVEEDNTSAEEAGGIESDKSAEADSEEVTSEDIAEENKMTDEDSEEVL